MESASSTSFSSGALANVVVANFKVGEPDGGFHVRSIGIDRLDGMRIISAFAEGLEQAVIMVEHLHNQTSRFVKVSLTESSEG